MNYIDNAHVCYKHQMLLSSLFLIWKEATVDLDRAADRKLATIQHCVLTFL